MSAYRCPEVPTMWHYGNLAEPVIRGEATRQEVYFP